MGSSTDFSLCRVVIPGAFAKQEYERGGMLKTDYDFRVTKADRGVLWYLPNETKGVTLMLPSDY